MTAAHRRSLVSLTLTVCVALAGIAGCAPYIYDPQEFNRERADFGREPKDRSEVNVCYFTRTTSPQDILAIAEAECGKFGKAAQYRYSEVGECPFATPTLARFACVAR